MNGRGSGTGGTGGTGGEHHCGRYREALSARMDGEALPVPPDDLDAHLSSCAGCASWLTAAQRVTRLARVGPAEPVPDFAAAIVDRARRHDRPAARRTRGRRWARLGLLAVALGQLAWWLPNLLFGDDSMAAPVHVAREVGVFNAALGVGFCWVVLRPARAAGLLAVLGAAVALLAAVEIADFTRGHVHPDRLAGHLLLAAGLVLVVILARAEARTPAPRNRYTGRLGRPGTAPPDSSPAEGQVA